MKKKFYVGGVIALIVFAIAGLVLAKRLAERERNEQIHYEREETELIVSNLIDAKISLFKAGKNLADTAQITEFNGERIWLRRGNYFLRAEHGDEIFFIPVPISGYRSGPDDGGAFVVTLRPLPTIYPPRLLSSLPEFVYIPSGNFLFGDRLNPREPHYLWLTGYFINPFEVSNPEFCEFLNWEKNPDAVITVVGIQNSYSAYQPNRFGLYHLTGNVVEWTQSTNRPYNRERPYADDDRNHDDTVGLRVARGGSWYSASIAILYIPYRDAFQPEHNTQDIEFRIVAKQLP